MKQLLTLLWAMACTHVLLHVGSDALPGVLLGHVQGPC
jgi:hypothetical protein